MLQGRPKIGRSFRATDWLLSGERGGRINNVSMCEAKIESLGPDFRDGRCYTLAPDDADVRAIGAEQDRDERFVP
jgi:hypothetical protein